MSEGSARTGGDSATGGAGSGHRYRLCYSKSGKIRFIGHRDLARIWERALRRGSLRTLYSEGFTPHPKLSFGLALPVGWESTAEFIDMSLEDEIAVDALLERLNEVLPDGMRVSSVISIRANEKSLASIVDWAEYKAEIATLDELGAWRSVDGAKVESMISDLLDAETLATTRVKRGVEVEEDLRPYILEMETEQGSGRSPVVRMILATKPRVVRPEEIAALLTQRGLDAEASLVRRTAQFAVVGDTFVDLMEADRAIRGDAA